MLTLAQAAKETGLTRSGLFKAIKNGKFSATKDEQGHFQIDPAELFRVYKPVNNKVEVNQQQETIKETTETAENRELRTRLEMTGQLLRQVEGERDDLRRRLDAEGEERRQSAEEIRRLTLMLTHQPDAPTRKAGHSGLWLGLLVALVASAAAGLFGYWWTLPGVSQ